MDRAARIDRARDARERTGDYVRTRSGDLKANTLGALAALGGLVALGGCGSQDGAAQQSASPAVASRVSPTATPAPPWSASERLALDRTLDAIFADDITERETGIVVVSADGASLFDRRASVPMAPASTLKLVVGAAALNRLGPQHRFETRFVAADAPDAGGALHGDLWLVGGGDPSLTSDDVRRGVGVLARTGVRQVDGALAIDGSAFAGPEQNPRWDPDDLSYAYAAGTSALSLDGNTVEFDVTPDPNGGSARVTTVPENFSIAFSGSIATVGSGYDSSVTIERKTDMPTFGATEADAAETEPHDDYVLDGSIPQGEMQKFYKPVYGIPGYVGGVVAAMFASRGIALAGGYRTGPAPSSAVPLWDHRSAPLADIEREMLVNSNNHTAETLLRVLGQTSGRPGTDAAGIAVEKSELARLGVPHERLSLYDGSGLAPSDRIMPLTLARLIAAEVRAPYGETFVRCLPRVGIEGTVKSHELHAALGRTRAKSGHIAGVNALAGIVQTKHHGRVAFAFVVNSGNANADIVYDEMDRALDALAER